MTADKARRHDARTSAGGRDRGGTNLVGSVAVLPDERPLGRHGRPRLVGLSIGRQGPGRRPRRARRVAEQKARRNQTDGLKRLTSSRRESSWIRRWKALSRSPPRKIIGGRTCTCVEATGSEPRARTIRLARLCCTCNPSVPGASELDHSRLDLIPGGRVSAGVGEPRTRQSFARNSQTLTGNTTLVGSTVQ